MLHLDPYQTEARRLTDRWISSVESSGLRCLAHRDAFCLVPGVLEYLMAYGICRPWWREASGINAVPPKGLSNSSRFFSCKDLLVPVALTGTPNRIPYQLKLAFLQIPRLDPCLLVIESDCSLSNLWPLTWVSNSITFSCWMST
jgi:hypothetical protein